MADLFRTLLITASDAPTSRAIAAAFGPGGSGMWQTPLSADGTEPATHFISSGYIPADFVGLAPCATWEQDEQGQWVQTDYVPGDAATVAMYAAQAGVSVTEAEVEGIFLRSDVTAQEPFVAMGRLGLMIVNPPEP